MLKSTSVVDATQLSDNLSSQTPSQTHDAAFGRTGGVHLDNPAQFERRARQVPHPREGQQGDLPGANALRRIRTPL